MPYRRHSNELVCDMLPVCVDTVAAVHVFEQRGGGYAGNTKACGMLSELRSSVVLISANTDTDNSNEPFI